MLVVSESVKKPTEKVVLVSPEGKKWVAEDKTQEVNLLAQGWRVKPVVKQAVAPANKAVEQKKTK